jgi:hypothetical protein
VAAVGRVTPGTGGRELAASVDVRVEEAAEMLLPLFANTLAAGGSKPRDP